MSISGYWLSTISVSATPSIQGTTSFICQFANQKEKSNLIQMTSWGQLQKRNDPTPACNVFGQLRAIVVSWQVDKLTSALFRRQWLTESRLAPFCPAFVSPCANISPGLKGYYAVCCSVHLNAATVQCALKRRHQCSVEKLLMCSLPLECESSARGACVCWQPWETVSNCPPPPTPSSPACIFIVSLLHPYPLSITKYQEAKGKGGVAVRNEGKIPTLLRLA